VHPPTRHDVRSVAATETVGPDGKRSPPPPPHRSEIQRWSQVAESDDLLDDALMYLGKANWFDIYKAIGGEETFLALGWEPAVEITRLKRTANVARHASHKFAPPPNPMPLDDARASLGRMLRRALG
jgi:hypothetical protein